MELKEYQITALKDIRKYLEFLSVWRKKAEDNPDLEIDFPLKAWEKTDVPRRYTSRNNGLNHALPNFCLKVPTGGGKTLLAVKTIDLVNAVYLKRQTGLVLWIVPTNQIYRQTLKQLKDRDHPYRQHLDIASGGNTIIVEKTDIFSPLDVIENLVVMLLMLPSANRKTKEVLKVFKDSSGFQSFFPSEDDIQSQEELLKRFPNLDTYETVSGFWGRQVKTSLGNSLRILSPLIILDEGHKAYSIGAQDTLRNFNPCMIVELSATPTYSNVLVDISGLELHREDMIKLDLHVVNKASPDWKDTLLAAHNKRCVLEEKAKDYESNTGIHIRPICLIQVERTGKEQMGKKFIHSESVKEYLIQNIGIPAEQIAIKTSEKDELKDVDDIGGLMTSACQIRYIITKQALQEGWDCAFAYVLAILSNPSSKNSLIQLVGRILRQPFARKTKVLELDESYVFCFRQNAKTLLDNIKKGFVQEGLGDLRGLINAYDESENTDDSGNIKYAKIRDRFRSSASRTLLPVFVVSEGDSWRPVNYEMDLIAKISWDEVDLTPVKSLILDMFEQKDTEYIATLSKDRKELLDKKAINQLKEGGVLVDSVFMTRQISDIIPNPWQAHEFSNAILTHFRDQNNEELLANNFVFIIEELRKQLEFEKDRLSEKIFHEMLSKDMLRFLIIGNDLDWTFKEPKVIKPDAVRLNKTDGSQLELSLFDFVPEDEFNDTEKAVAWYLENQIRLFFWYRNISRRDYSIQGWRQHRIYPDFIFTTSDIDSENTYQSVYVIETKGLHIKDNEKTNYIRKLFDVCTNHAKTRNWNELGLEMKDKILRFEVLAEDEWKAKLNEIMQ